MEKSIFFNHIRSRYGCIKRCRGSYLYTSKEVRLIDLYQEGGRAILGWREGKAMQVLKNTLEKGLWGSYPDVSGKRLEKALGSLFTYCGVSHFSHFSWYYETSESIALLKKNIPVVYPWSGISPQGLNSAASSVLFVPPFPFPSIIVGASVSSDSLPVSDFFSSSMLEAMSRAVYDLIDAFKLRKDESWALYDDFLSPYFRRDGSALYTTLSIKDYDEFVLHCLDCGLVINPSSEYPSFVPYGVSKNLFKKLDRNDSKGGTL